MGRFVIGLTFALSLIFIYLGLRPSDHRFTEIENSKNVIDEVSVSNLLHFVDLKKAKSLGEGSIEKNDSSNAVIKVQKSRSKMSIYARDIFFPLEVNFDQLVDDAIQEGRSDILFGYVNRAIKVLPKCLAEYSRCGQRPASGHFNPEKTEMHDFLARSLMVEKTLIEKDRSFLDRIEKNDLVSALKIQNDQVPIYSAELLVEKDPTQTGLTDLLTHTRDLVGDTRVAIFQIAGNHPAAEVSNGHQLFLKELGAALGNANDPFTAEKIQTAIGSMSLNQSEYRLVSSNSCFLAGANKASRSSWYRKLIETQIASQNYDLRFEEVCSN